MATKMIANRAVYRAAEGKEYQKGESFTVDSESDVKRLVRTKRARVDAESPRAATRAPKRTTQAAVIETKVITAEPAPAEKATEPEANRYFRSDMRAED